MRKLIVALILVLSAHQASAQQAPAEKHGVGLGIEQTLGGVTGATFIYDAGRFHIDVLLGISNVHFTDPDESQTTLALAGRLFFVIASSQSADFSLGGGLAIVNFDPEFGSSETNIQIEGAAQIRAFLVPQVALSASLGVAFITADDFVIGGASDENREFNIGGQLAGTFGMAYFFP